MTQVNDKMKITKKKIEEVEEENRELSSMYDKINQKINTEEAKEKDYDAQAFKLYNFIVFYSSNFNF